MTGIEHIFLDRDGTVIEERHYLADPEGVVLLPGVGEALADCVKVGCSLHLVSNQSGIGRGLFSVEDCRRCQDRLAELLRAHRVRFADMLYCPHAPEEDCKCRKPRLGLWHKIKGARKLKPQACAMVGDKCADVAFGLAAGFGAVVLVLTGHGAEHAALLGLPPLPAGVPVLPLMRRNPDWPHALAQDLPAAVEYLLSL